MRKVKATKAAYNRHSKPINKRYGRVRDGNLGGKDYNEMEMFTTEGVESFNGFAGTSEFDGFPLRQLFVHRHAKLPSEWDTGYFKTKDINDYVLKHKKHVLAIHYAKNKEINKCLLYLGTEDHVYVYIYNRGAFNEVEDKIGVCLLFTEKTEAVDKLMDYFIKLVIPEDKPNQGKLNVLIQTPSGFDLRSKEVAGPDIDFSINYNEDFKPIHELITNKLSVDNSKGLVLLHGLPGTGKTTYIRYLINNLNKRIIYIPPNMVNLIADPGLVNFFIDKSNSILVIEDAESILMKRNASSTQAIANILNLSDGLLSDCANIQIIATFNMDILNIDEALLRKGRLIAKYKFEQLEKNRALKLSKKLGVDIKSSTTLADIYNARDDSFEEKNTKIGF